MRFNISCGHAKSGKYVGASGVFSESEQNRKVLAYMKQLQHLCNDVVISDCTINDASSYSSNQNFNLAICKNHNVCAGEIDIQLHFNAGGGEGCECWIYDNNSTKAKKYANLICNNLAWHVGFKNRGVKTNSGYIFLNSTKKEAIIVEICFCDSQKDWDLFNVKEVAYAIMMALKGESI